MANKYMKSAYENNIITYQRKHMKKMRYHYIPTKMDEIKATESISKNAELTELPMGVQTGTTILENWQ